MHLSLGPTRLWQGLGFRGSIRASILSLSLDVLSPSPVALCLSPLHHCCHDTNDALNSGTTFHGKWMPMTHLILGHFMGSGDARDHHHTKIQAMTRGSEQCRLTCLSLDLLPTWTAVVVLSEKTVVHQRRGCDHVSRKVR